MGEENRALERLAMLPKARAIGLLREIMNYAAENISDETNEILRILTRGLYPEEDK